MNARARAARQTIRTMRRANRALKAETAAGRVERLGFGAVALEAVYAVPERLAVDLVAEYSVRQVDDALELIAEGAIVPLRRPTWFFAISSDGTDKYFTNLDNGTCTCPAGENGRTCYHTAAARLLAAC